MRRQVEGSRNYIAVLSFVTHSDVLLYLNEYKQQFDLDCFIKYGSNVVQLSVLLDQSSQVNVMGEPLPKIRLEWEENTNAETKSRVFDAVCIANGHYAMPNIPYLKGIESYQGRTMHSIEYDSPECFASETVLCVGGRASGSDLAKEISRYASHVYLSDSKVQAAETQGNVTFVPRSISINAEGCIAFANDCRITPRVDTIIFCTGYDYHFPFINDNSNLELSVKPGERRVMPLYKQLWHTDCPNLSFIGLPHSVVPFPLFEFQAEAVVKQILTGGKDLPLKSERRKQGKHDAEAGGATTTGAVKDTHYLGPAQWDYCRQLAIIAHEYDNDVENFISTNRVSVQVCICSVLSQISYMYVQEYL